MTKPSLGMGFTSLMESEEITNLSSMNSGGVVVTKPLLSGLYKSSCGL